jgi:hypothetical protein
VTGFVSGVGSFTFHRSGRQLLLVFAVRLPARGRPLLESIRKFFRGSGKIYDVAAGASCYLRVNRSAELLRIVDHFERYPLRGAKRRGYEIWREMVLVKAAHFGGPSPPELDQLAEKLSKSGVGTQPRA